MNPAITFTAISLQEISNASTRLQGDRHKLAQGPLPQPTQDTSLASLSVDESLLNPPEEELRKETPTLEECKKGSLAARHRRFPSANIPYQMSNPHTNIGRLNHTAFSAYGTQSASREHRLEGEENIPENPSPCRRKPATQSPTKCMIVQEHFYRSDSTSSSGGSSRPSSHTSAGGNAKSQHCSSSENSSPLSLECTETLLYEERVPQNKENMPPPHKRRRSEHEERKRPRGRSGRPPSGAAKDPVEQEPAMQYEEELIELEAIASEKDFAGPRLLCAEEMVIPRTLEESQVSASEPVGVETLPTIKHQEEERNHEKAED